MSLPGPRRGIGARGGAGAVPPNGGSPPPRLCTRPAPRGVSPNCQRATPVFHRRPSRADVGPPAESQGRGTPPSTTPTKGDEPRAATAHPFPNPKRERKPRTPRLARLGGPPPPCGKGRTMGPVGPVGRVRPIGPIRPTCPSPLPPSKPPSSGMPNAPRRLSWRLVPTAHVSGCRPPSLPSGEGWGEDASASSPCGRLKRERPDTCRTATLLGGLGQRTAARRRGRGPTLSRQEPAEKTSGVFSSFSDSARPV